jgi:hypothetical protein
MKFDFDSTTPGISTLSGGELYNLKQSPFMTMARICRLEGDAVGAHSEGDVDNIGKQDVAVVLPQHR